MTALELVALAATTVWLGVLTLVAVLMVRQIGLIGVRLDRDQDRSAPVGDGLPVGTPLPTEVGSLLEPSGDAPAFILILGAVCTPCREMAQELSGFPSSSRVLALVSGNRDLALELSELLPKSMPSLIDPAAERAVRALRIATTPFVVEVRAGVIAVKAALRGADHLERFVEEAESVSTDSLGPEVQTYGG